MAEDIILKVALDGAQRELDNLSKLQKGIKELSAEKKRLNQNEKELTKAINSSGAATSEQNAQLEKIHAQQIENTNSLKLTKTAYRENEAQVIRNTRAQQGNTGSLVQMRAALAKDQRAYDLLSKAERENEKVGGKLQKRIKAQSDELKGLEKNTGRAQRNVGNYGEAMNDVLPIMGGFGSQIQTLQRSLGAIKSALNKTAVAQSGMAKSTKASSNSLKTFRIALISTGIGAIVVLLGTLIAAFLSTQRGVDGVTKVLRPLQEIFASLLGVVQDLATKGFDRIKKAIADPKQAFKDFGEFIKNQFITRVLAIPKAFIAINKLIISSIKLLGVGIKKAVADVPLLGRLVDKKSLDKDLKEAKESVAKSFKDFTDAQIELAIGVDAEKVREAGAKAGEFFAEAAARGAEIDRLTKQIETSEITLNRELKKGLRIFEEQRAIAEDRRVGTEKQLAAAAAAQAQLKKNVALEQGHVDLQLKLAKLKTEANDTDREAQKEIQDLIAQKEEIEAKGLKKGLLLRNKANSIAEKAEKERLKAISDEEKAKKKAVEDASKLEVKAIDEKIERLNLERQLELATVDETNEEKYKKEKELLEKISKLRVDKAKKEAEQLAEKQTEKIEDDVERAKEKERIIGEAVTEQKLINQVEEAELTKEEQKRIDGEKLEQEKFLKNQGLEIASQAGKALVDGAAARAEREKDIELANLNAKLQGGLISQEDFEKKKNEIEKTAFKKKKARDLAVVAIDLAKEISSINVAAAGNPANPFTFGAAGISQAAVLSAIAIARSAVQAGVIASQKFAHGGVIHGASHAQGGVPVNVGGSGMIEAEGGEAIINKRSTSKHLGLLSAINQDGGGVALARNGMVTPNFSSLSKFGNGGVATTAAAAQAPSFNLEDLREAFSDTVNNIKVQNVASETTGVANRVQQIEDSASF